MGSTSETASADTELCEDEASAPDAHSERDDERPAARVTVILIDNGQFRVDALDLF